MKVAILKYSIHLCYEISKHQNNAPEPTMISVLMCLLKCHFVQLKSWGRTTKSPRLFDFNGAFHMLTHPEVYQNGKVKFK